MVGVLVWNRCRVQNINECRLRELEPARETVSTLVRVCLLFHRWARVVVVPSNIATIAGVVSIVMIEAVEDLLLGEREQFSSLHGMGTFEGSCA